RQTDAPFLRCGKKDVGSCTGNPAGTDRGHWCADESNHVVDSITRFDMAAGRRNQDPDRSIRFLSQSNQTLAGGLCRCMIDFTEYKDETRFEGKLFGEPFEPVHCFFVFVQQLSHESLLQSE